MSTSFITSFIYPVYVEKWPKYLENKVYLGNIMDKNLPESEAPKKTPEGYGAPVSQKGYAPGTFNISMKKGDPRKPVITGVPNFRVGGEIKNPEMEEIIRLGTFAKKEGFNFTVNDAGEIEADIPSDFLQEEDALRVKLQKNEEVTSLLKEIIPISVHFTALVKDCELLTPKIKSPTTSAIIEKVSEEIAKLLRDTEKEPARDKVTELNEKLSEFERVVERATDEVARLPKPPVTAPVASTPVTPAKAIPAPAPVQKALNEYSGWPYGILSFRKVKGNGKGEWFSNTNSVIPLPNQEEWAAEKNLFDIIFSKYSNFIKNKSIKERQLASDLIDAKNKLVEALKKQDLSAIGILRGEFELAIENWEKKWPAVIKLKKIEEQFDKDNELAKKIEAVIDDTAEKFNLQKRKDELEKLIKETLVMLISTSITEDEYADLEKKASSYTSLLLAYKQKFFSADRRRPVLRPIQMGKAKDDTKINTIGRGEMLLKDRAEEVAVDATKETTTKASEKAQSTELLERKHISMYERAPVAYIQMYTIRREQKQSDDTIQVSYYLKNFIAGDQNKSVVEKMLSDTTSVTEKLSGLEENKNKSVTFVLKESPENRREPVVLPENRSTTHPDSIRAYRQVYSPVRDTNKGSNFPTGQSKLDTATTSTLIPVEKSKYTKVINEKDLIPKLTKPQAMETNEISADAKKKWAIEKLWNKVVNQKITAGHPNWVNAVTLSSFVAIGGLAYIVTKPDKDSLVKKEIAERMSPNKAEDGWKAYLTEEEKLLLPAFEKNSPSNFIAEWLNTKDQDFVTKVSNYRSEDIKDILLNPQTNKATDSKGVNHQLAISQMIQFIQNVSQKRDAPVVYQSRKDSSFYTDTKNWWVGPGETFTQFLQAVHVKIYKK